MIIQSIKEVLVNFRRMVMVVSIVSALITGSSFALDCNTIDVKTSASFKITEGKACNDYAELKWSFKRTNGAMLIEWGTSESYGNKKSIYEANPIRLENLQPGTTYFYHTWGEYTKMGNLKTYEYYTGTFTTSGSASVNNPPEITSTSTVACTSGTEKIYTVTATDRDNDAVTFSVNDLPSWITFATPALTLKPTTGSGNTTVTIIADDGNEGLDTLNLSVTVHRSKTSVITGLPAALGQHTIRIGKNHISFQAGNDPQTSVSLFSVNGSRIMNRRINGTGRETTEIHTGSLVPGIYLLRIGNSAGTHLHILNLR